MREKKWFFSESGIQYTLDKSLERLQNGLYRVYFSVALWEQNQFFGQRGFKVQDDAWEDNIHAVLETLKRFYQQGK